MYLAEFLRKEWPLFMGVALSTVAGMRAKREARAASREPAAAEWPATDATAECWVRPAAWGRSRLYVRAVQPEGERVLWTRVFSTRDEARHYAAALEAKTVAIHVNPWKRDEKILRWDELRRQAPAFVWADGGRMSAREFGGVKAFRAVAFLGAALAVADVGMFATPWGRTLEWHGLCLCDLSIGLLFLGVAMLIPAQSLRLRMAAVAGGLMEDGRSDWRGATRWITMVSAGAWAGLFLFLLWVHGDTSDVLFFGLVTVPVIPLAWWSVAVGARASRRLRPLGEAAARNGVEVHSVGPAVQVKSGLA